MKPRNAGAAMAMELRDAIEHHRRGELERAAVIYEAALALEPERADALHLLGLVALQKGDARRAADLIGRAVAVRPDEADYHAGLGETYWALGQPERAVACYLESLRLRPGNAHALNNLGSTLLGQGGYRGGDRLPA